VLIRLNATNFLKLQGDMTEKEMAKHLNVARTQLWRIKQGHSSAGEKFISKVMSKYPKAKFGDIFIAENREAQQ